MCQYISFENTDAGINIVFDGGQIPSGASLIGGMEKVNHDTVVETEIWLLLMEKKILSLDKGDDPCFYTYDLI